MRCILEAVAGRSVGVFVAIALVAPLTVSIAGAQVKTTTTTRYHSVGGSTAKSLVMSMRSRPVSGDSGAALANIRPYYRLDVATRTSGGTCRASTVALNIRFVMTLPRARSASTMRSSTRSAWNAFASFARRHEQHHRSIYIQCGNSFIAKAKRMTNGSCAALQSSIRRLLEREKRACEGRNRAFDRGEKARLLRLSLFRMARG
jgi:predicted secreted Zn-dependent protease